MKKVLKVLAIVVTVVVLAVAGIISYIKTALPNVGAAPDLKIELTPERIKHGEYLAKHVTICIDCHSKRDFNLWSGPIVPGTFGQGGEAFTREAGFPGNFYSKNLTPYHLSNWTDGEIFRTITTGVNKDGKALFNLMPYEHYGKMDPEDIMDIIAYLRTLKPISNDPPASVADFPVNIILNTIPQKAKPQTRPDRSNTLAWGGYMVNSAGCIICHTKAEKGKVVGEPFAGGFEFYFPGGLAKSANITPDNEFGIGKWSEAAFLAKFKQYNDTSYHAIPLNPSEAHTVMPWTMFADMDSIDLKAIFAYLRTVSPVNKSVQKWTPKTETAKM